MRAQHVPGISLAMVRNGSAMQACGYGYADLGLRTPAQPQTIYRIGSLTKSFTAAALLRLAAESKVRLADPIAAYVPVPWEGVTLEDLLAQRSGIPSYEDVAALSRYGRYTPRQLVDALAQLPLQFSPGTQYAYSNTNYVLLGMVIERASATTYGEFLRENILRPMRLHDTRYGDPNIEAHGYATGTLNAPMRRSTVSFAYAAAGMTSSATDMIRWLGSVRDPFYGFTAETIYGYPVETAHGYVDGYSAFALIQPQAHDTVVILSNANAIDLQPLAMDVFATIETPKPGTQAP